MMAEAENEKRAAAAKQLEEAPKQDAAGKKTEGDAAAKEKPPKDAPKGQGAGAKE